MAALKVRGTIRVPGDKSITHRALMMAVLAEGESRIQGALVSADTAATATVLREMGADIPPLSPAMVVRGSGLGGLRAPVSPLECGNSGTTARLVAGIVAAHPFAARFVGDDSLSRRPMARVARPLEAMGAHVELEKGDGLPMVVHGGRLRPIDWTLETDSAQVKSVILFAALVGGVRATIRGSGRSRDHTERMLVALGGELSVEDGSATVEPSSALSPLELSVPADPSSAAFFAGFAAAASEGEVALTEVCVNPTRTEFFRVLQEMGGSVSLDDESTRAGEPVATVRVRSAALEGVTITAERAPGLLDELPLLGCLGAIANGETRVTGARELRVKESDRIAGLVSNLRAVGADADELDDGFIVRGSRRELRGRVATNGDHRIAMAFGVLARLTGNSITVDDPDCVAVSYPDFWQDLERVAGARL